MFEMRVQLIVLLSLSVFVLTSTEGEIFNFENESLGLGVFHSYSQSESESIDIDAPSTSLPPVHLPHLVYVTVRAIDWSDQSATEQFFNLNPQIEKLALYTVPEYGIERILLNLPNVRELSLTIQTGQFECNNFAIFGVFSKCLQSLEMTGLEYVIMAKILNALLANDIRLKHLTVLDAKDKYPIALILQMKSIEYLKINHIDDTILSQIAENCIDLSEIDAQSRKLTLTGILKMIENASSLDKAKFALRTISYKPIRITIDEKMLDTIAILCEQRRTTIKLEFVKSYRTTIAVSVMRN